jgi:hypothetical protein
MQKTKTKRRGARPDGSKNWRDRSYGRGAPEFYADKRPFLIHDSTGSLPCAVDFPTEQPGETFLIINSWPLAWFEEVATALLHGRRVSLPVEEAYVGQTASCLVRGLQLWSKPDRRGKLRMAVCAYDGRAGRLVAYSIDDQLPEDTEEE